MNKEKKNDKEREYYYIDHDSKYDEYSEFAEDPDDGVSGAERLGFVDWVDDDE